MFYLAILFLLNVVSTTHSSLHFAESLFVHKDYFNSATEYERYLFHNPSDTLISNIKLKLAQAYLKSNETNRAEKILRELSSQETKYSQQSKIDLSRLHISQGEFINAKIELNDLLFCNNNIQDSVKKEINCRLGYIALQENDLTNAIKYFTQASDSIMVARSKALTKLPPKNVLLSQILSSVIPGTGEMYCGKYGQGIMSLLVNSVSIYGMIYTYRHEYYIDAALIFSLFFMRFYNGSRNNARDFAQLYNEQIYKQKLKQLNITQNIFK